MVKKLLLTALLFCPLFGQAQATTGYHRVNQVLARAPMGGVTANVVPNAKITVTNTATGLSATIYSDPLITAQITPSVVTADSSGNYSYYLPLNYCVTETITAPGQKTQTIPNICQISTGLSTPISIINGGTGQNNAPAAAVALVNNNPIAPSSIIDTSVATSPSTYPICPNGVGGAFTTIGCLGGGDSITSPNSTLTVGGSVSATTLDINLSHANTWIATQTFNLVVNSLVGYEVNGSPFATGNLTDWTNAGVANLYLPNWNSSTSKWTPIAVHGTGSGDTYVQKSDNSGSGGSVANFDTNGGLTGLGLATAPSGACSPNGTWVLSQDGNETWCHSGTWTAFTALAGISGIDFASSPVTPSSGIINFAVTSPIVGTPSGNTITFSCPTCSVGSGTSVTVNGGSALGTLNINATAPTADASFFALTPKITGSNMIIEAPYATGSAFGVVEGDGSTLTITAGVISCTTATSSQIGCAKLGATGGSNVYLGYTPAHSGANSDITSLTGLTTPLSVPQGGSGEGSFTDYTILSANASGTGPFQGIGPGTAGQALISGGAGAYAAYGTLGSGAGGTGTTTLSGIRRANSGSADTSATAHQMGVPLLCADSSGSSTAQSCTTTPTFTPASPDWVTYTTTTANTGTGLTINVNSLGAKSVAIPGLSGWTTTLVAGVIEANKPILMYYDGANWDAVQTGTVAAAGSGNTTINGTACALGGSCSPPIQGGPVTTSTYTIANTYSSGIILNTQATTTSSFTVTLPTPAFGKLWCATNFVNSSNVAETGQIELLVANTGTQSIVYKGAVSSSGYVLSTGAAGDYGCVFGASSTQWNFTPSDGTTWGLH